MHGKCTFHGQKTKANRYKLVWSDRCPFWGCPGLKSLNGKWQFPKLNSVVFIYGVIGGTECNHQVWSGVAWFLNAWDIRILNHEQRKAWEKAPLVSIVKPNSLLEGTWKAFDFPSLREGKGRAFGFNMMSCFKTNLNSFLNWSSTESK